MYVCVYIYIYITFYKGKTFIKRYSALKCERKKSLSPKITQQIKILKGKMMHRF